jgi:hypothetical protein
MNAEGRERQSKRKDDLCSRDFFISRAFDRGGLLRGGRGDRRKSARAQDARFAGLKKSETDKSTQPYDIDCDGRKDAEYC